MSEQRPVSVDPAEPERRACDIDVGERIGIGGMGFVHEAYDRSLRRTLALKSLRQDTEGASHARERFIEEAQITSQLDHPNIVPVHEIARHDETGIYFTMKLVNGTTLSKMVAGLSPVTRSSEELYELLQVLLRICDAVSFAHSRGVIHRDLKPDNIMVGAFGEVYLMDWGIAKISGQQSDFTDGERARHEHRTEVGTAVGTLNYMSPEQAAGLLDDVDERSDIFALGAILYEILTQSAPYSGGSVTELLESARRCDLQAPQERVEYGLPPILCKICLKAMAPHQKHRYQSVRDFKKDIERFLQSGWQFPVRRFEPGETIVYEGMTGDTAYAIIEGRCEVVRVVDGVSRILRELGPGDVFGETAVFGDQRRTATVLATEAVTAMEISRAHFEEDLGMGYWMGLFVRALAERFAEKEQQLLKLEAEVETLRKG